MYCKNCGKKISDEAGFCPYCGVKTAVMLPEPKRETENFIQAASMKDENKALPVYKRNGKKRIAVFFIGFILLIYAIIHLMPLNDNLPKETRTEQISEEPVTEEPVQPQSSEIVPEPVKEQPEETSEPAETTAPAVVNATWNVSTKEHDNITVNSLLKFDGNYVWNFSDCTAVGKSAKSDIITETEADYGFIICVAGDDEIIVVPYDNSDTGIVPVSVTAELASGNYISTETADAYEITGYSDCENGIGLVTVTFSDDAVLRAGVFKNNGKLYVTNVSKQTTVISSFINDRLKFEAFMDKAGITEKDAVYTDPIYYPIVPVGDGEVTDTANWIVESSKIVESDWSDAHKVMELYNYVIENFAYDYWVLSTGYHARSFYYNDYSGKYYISKTHVGVCEDFSQILAIMCRAQGIPALEVHSEPHAMTAVYIEDYGRWLLVDTTADVMHGANSEDYTVWTDNGRNKYSHLNRITDGNFIGIGIGNYEDMKKFDIPTYD